MKKSLRNFVLACTATVAVSLALATSAFAADGFNITGDITYDQAAGTVTVSSDFLGTLNGQTTILIYEDGADPANLTADQILYINQDDVSTGADTFADMGLKGGLTENKTYVVRMGGENVTEGIYEGTFKVGEGGDTITVIWGDVNRDNDFCILDASAIVDATIGGEKSFEDGKFVLGEEVATGIIWGDVNRDNDFGILDASAIVDATIGGEKSFEDGAYVLGSEKEISITK